MSFLKSLLGRSGWDSIPNDIIDHLRQKLSETEFDSLTELCFNYNVFPQMDQAVKKETGFGPTYTISERLKHLAVFLSNVGNEVFKHAYIEEQNKFNKQMLKDGSEFSKVALLLKPDDYSARMDLATYYNIIGKTQESQNEAKRALADLDKWIDFTKEHPIPSEVEDMIEEKTGHFKEEVASHDLEI